MRLTYRSVSGVGIIDVVGSVIRLDGHHLYQSFTTWTREAPEGTDFILNFRDATVIDSISMHALLALRKSAHRPESPAGRVVLVVNPMVRKLLDIVRILPMFCSFDRLEDAHVFLAEPFDESIPDSTAAVYGPVAESVPLSVLERMSVTAS